MWGTDQPLSQPGAAARRAWGEVAPPSAPAPRPQPQAGSRPIDSHSHPTVRPHRAVHTTQLHRVQHPAPTHNPALCPSPVLPTVLNGRGPTPSSLLNPQSWESPRAGHIPPLPSGLL